MKVAINNCYGGFSLSPLAIERIATLNGRGCYFFKQAATEPYVPITIEEAAETFIFWAFDVPNPNDFVWLDSLERTPEENAANDEWYKVHSLDSRPENRADPILIQVIEELGKKANGTFAKLKVVKIPDGIEYEIDEYDGIESIHETHRSWGD